MFAVTRDDALEALNRFIEERLVNFGDYQDAMTSRDPWLFHNLSMYLNNGLLQPEECIELAERPFMNQKHRSILLRDSSDKYLVGENTLEGFIGLKCQIIEI